MTVVETSQPSVVKVPFTPTLEMCVFRSFDDINLTCEVWDDFVQSVQSDLYSSYDWCRTWWDHYGTGRELRILVFRSGHSLAGIIPLLIDNTGFGPGRIRLAKPLGTDSTTAFWTPALKLDHADTIVARTIEYIIDEEHCDAINFGPMPVRNRVIDALRLAESNLADLAEIIRDEPGMSLIMFRLPADFDGYLSGLSKKQRTTILQEMRRLERDCGLETRVIKKPGKIEAAYKAFVELHGLQWRAQGKLGHFGDWPGAEMFNLDLIQKLAGENRARIIELQADGELVSSQIVLRFGNQDHWRLPARSPDSCWEKYSLGRVGLAKIIEIAINDDVRSIEAGTGHYEYKIRMGGEENTLHSIMFVARKRHSQRRVKWFIRGAAFLHRWYYRVWFCRIAPRMSRMSRMPRMQEPLWKVWRHSRL